jgi:hypothetical protein
VLHVFDRACNLVDEGGAVVAIVTSDRAMAPFGIAVSTSHPSSEPALFAAVTEDSLVQRTPGRLGVGPLWLDYSAARAWDPRPDWDALATGLAAEPGRVTALARRVAERHTPGSLLDLFLVPAGASPLAPELLARARAGLADLTAGLLGGQPEQTVAGALRLAGLGGGLTPAGDDFAVGACLASWAGLYGPAAQGLGPVVEQAMVPSTTTLSAAYIRAAVRGQCAAPWHALFAALVQPPRRERGSALSAAVDALLSLGHTSGADGLAGFLAPHFLGSAH